jgi:2-polyprenyl-3-methyl-5-hydroxy-6-metoxy-1,4-benzoquinol methylase
LTGTPQYISWVTRVLRPHLGDRVLEIGAGIGNLTGRLMARKLHYVAGEADGLYLHALRNRFLRTPNVTVCELHPEDPADYVPGAGQFDTVLCVNVLESAKDPVGVLTSLRSCLAPGGSVLVLVPQGKGLYGSLDRGMGQLRRFSREELGQMLGQTGFQIEQMYQLNKIGTLSWWIFGKVLGRKAISRPALKLFDKTVWFWRRVDGLLPWPGLSLVAVAKKI